MIVLSNVSKRYGDTPVLESTSYTFPQTGLVCLVGPSGGGKTTLLNLIAGFDTHYEGSITVGGASLTGMSAERLCEYRKSHVGFVFQNYHLLKGYTALQNVLLPADLAAEEQEANQQQAKALLHQLGLGDKLQQKSETLSGGQKQRVAIARALLGNPQQILADEPTGALDRKTSLEIMDLLKEIAKEKLVVIITHDEKILPFADEVLRIEERKLVSEANISHADSDILPPPPQTTRPTNPMKRALQNFRVHQKRYLAVALAISIGLSAFLMSLSFKNVMQDYIEDFQEKNTALHNGYIKGADDGTVLKFLKEDQRLENVYFQYKLSDITLNLGDTREILKEKYPMPKSTESLSYGVMPRRGMHEIALSPSLAKKLNSNISSLVGKELTLTLSGEDYLLTVSGIYNAAYDDFFVSSDVEQEFYAKLEPSDNYSISYDVKQFEDIVAVSNRLQLHQISAQNASKEVFQLQETFHSLQRLFFIVSALVLLCALFLCTMLILRLQNSRYREVGLLSALGFSKNSIRSLILGENILLSLLSAILNALLLSLIALVCWSTGISISFHAWQVLSCSLMAALLIMAISSVSSINLIRTEPAVALQK